MEPIFAGSAPLRDAIRSALPQLHSITEEHASRRPGGGTGWSRKEELGHLLDSATNNRVRFINASLKGDYDGPGYSAEGWVSQGGYAQMPWAKILQVWVDANDLLAEVIDRIPEGRLNTACVIGGGPSVTLQFVVEDYVAHLLHHLGHLLEPD